VSRGVALSRDAVPAADGQIAQKDCCIAVAKWLVTDRLSSRIYTYLSILVGHAVVYSAPWPSAILRSMF